MNNANNKKSRLIIYRNLPWILFFALSSSTAHAEITGDVNTDFTSNPVNLVDGAAMVPRVVINTSNDHQLYFKAFNDFSDLDGNGAIETTYKHSVDYYGYFDSYKCYDYERPVDMNGTGINIDIHHEAAVGITDDDRAFVPKAITGDKYCTGGNSGYWSGNFLNWASMARIDVVRKLLFGGHRRVDTATATILERTYLPKDAHSWAKHYDGADIPKLTPFSIAAGDYDCDQSNMTAACTADKKMIGITIGNTTDVDRDSTQHERYSQNVTNPPIIKVVKGNYSLWGSNERFQLAWEGHPTNDSSSNTNANISANSGIDAYDSNPNWTERIEEGNYIARVQACVEGLIGEEKCKLYPGADSNGGTSDDNLKPIGLLQVFGDDDQMYFGMVAGSYLGHANGGVLIRNMESLSDEVNVDSDGTFPLVGEFAGGPLKNGTGGLMNAWSLYRIVGYNTETGTYNDSGDGDSCPWGLSAFADVTGTNTCQNWGNPFAEIYYQSLNYFSGNGVIGDYRNNESAAGIAGLPNPQPFVDPLDDDSWCAPLSIINFNSSVISYDADELDANTYQPDRIWDASDLPSGAGTTTSQMTDIIGAGEGLHGNDYFFGLTDVDSGAGDELCTSKTLTSLGDAGGICPDAPRLSGSYRIAGLAYYAHIADLRPDGNATRGLESSQTTDTYSVAMSSAVPIVDIPHPNNPTTTAITLIPACRNTSLNPDGNCAIVDFKVVSQITNDGSGVGSGKIYVDWEDSEQGGDYDQDMWGTIDYTIDTTTSPATLEVTTQVHAQSAGFTMGFGYALSGTDGDDGVHFHSGINGFTWTDDATGDDCFDADGDGDAAGCNCRNSHGGCDLPDSGSSYMTYDVGIAGTASQLKDPLWYASKWGAFTDSDGDNTPNLQSEWDKENNLTGQDGPDGIPDSFFYASNPNELEQALTRIFNEILERVSSGTAAAVVSNNVRGEGQLYQAFYEPSAKDDTGKEATWIGNVRALWLDSYGLLREDNNANAQMDDYQTDLVIESYYDGVESRTRVRRWTSSSTDEFIPTTHTIVELDEVLPIWSASRSLSGLILNSKDVTSQRSYGATFQQNGRHIFTWLDDDSSGTLGKVDSGEVVAFDSNTFDLNNYGYLNIIDRTVADAAATTAALDQATADADEVTRLNDQTIATADAATSTTAAANALNDANTAEGDTITTQTATDLAKTAAATAETSHAAHPSLALFTAAANDTATADASALIAETDANVAATSAAAADASPPTDTATAAAALTDTTIAAASAATAATDAAQAEASTATALAADAGDADAIAAAAAAVAANTAAQASKTSTETAENSATAAHTAAVTAFNSDAVAANSTAIANNSATIAAGSAAVSAAAEQDAHDIATNLVNYIRGLDQSGMRNRTIDHDNINSTPEVSLILGDIVNSTPTVVSAPQEGMNLLYGDASYAEFLVKYTNRRTVIYTGANDGMLHAFNGGFANSNNQISTNGLKIDGSAATAHELGAELWAYVPQNLLPHLKWLAQPNYKHVYYVDGKPRIVDAKIFTPDTTHINGWGTVLVMGMRLGGGAITADTDSDGLGINNSDSDTTDDRTFHSAYIIMDITNPEEAPTLLAEVPLLDGSYTTVYPTFFKIKDLAPATDPNKFFLMLGSGPNNHITAASNSTAKVYIYNPIEMQTGLNTMIATTDTGTDAIADCSIDSTTAFDILVCDTKQADTFIGDPIAVDWELDYKDDALYFGTIGDEDSDVGSLYRLALDGDKDTEDWHEPVVLYDAQLPISAGATVGTDNLKNHWVYFGTGRIWAEDDLSSTETQSLFGVKDSYDPSVGSPSQLITADLLNVTDIKIVNFMRGTISAFNADFSTTMTVSALQGNAGDGPYQSWDLTNFTTLETGISNTSNSLAAVGSSANFFFRPSASADTIGDDILTWTTDGNLINPPVGITTFDDLETAIDDGIWEGWYINLAPIRGVAGTDPATRSTTQSALIGGSLFTSVYQPSINPCESEGFSQLYGVYYKTGTAHPDRLAFGVQYDTNTNEFTETHIDLGRGFATAPSIHSGSGTGSDTVSVFTQLSTGSIERDEGGLIYSGRSGWLSWRCNQ